MRRVWQARLRPGVLLQSVLGTASQSERGEAASSPLSFHPYAKHQDQRPDPKPRNGRTAKPDVKATCVSPRRWRGLMLRSQLHPLDLNPQWSPAGKTCTVHGEPALGETCFSRAY